ncbi:MAG: hypothetical protein HYY06_15740 [Deltaproteobacteria bacterium]|nr:hypothetical protein [Deltaproteobacteria bacterium]
MQPPVYGLEPARFLRSIDASRGSLGKAPTRLIDVVEHVGALTDGSPYAIVGGLAQILWARKTHTDDLDVALAAQGLTRAADRVRRRSAGRGWRVPRPPDRLHEEDDVFEVYHLLFRGTVVDLLSFKDQAFTEEILTTARIVPELSGCRFIAPELLLITHLLRPGPLAALAAVELVLARGALGGLDLEYAEKWAARLGRTEALRRTLVRAEELGKG